MAKTIIVPAFLFVVCALRAAPGATWYVDASVLESGDGTSWETAFMTVWEGVIAADEGDTVIVAPGIYNGRSSAEGTQGAAGAPGEDTVAATGAFPLGWKNITLRSLDPLNPRVVASTILDGGGTRSVISFGGTEDASMVLSGFTICNGYNAMHGGGINGRGTHATIRNSVIVNNRAVAPKGSSAAGGGLHDCDGVIEANRIAGNLAMWEEWWVTSRATAGGLYGCDGIIRNNIISGNEAWTWGGGLESCDGAILNNVIVGNSAPEGGGVLGCYGTITNCIITRNDAYIAYPNIGSSSQPTYSCVDEEGEGNTWEDPRFVDEENGDFRLRADSPCIDAGFNDPQLPEFDIAGMHRIMFGGKSLTVDMGAYEFYINKLEPVPGTNEAVFTWSSLESKTYSIFYTDDLFNWHLAIDNFPSLSNTTTSWTDDGSLTGLPPLLAPKRFYRLLENP